MIHSSLTVYVEYEYLMNILYVKKEWEPKLGEILM